MEKVIEERFSELQAQTQSILRTVAAVSSSTYYFKPGGKWSISQIMTHLLVAERLSLQYMQKKIQGVATLQDTGVRENMMFWLLKFSQRVPLKYNAPEVVLDNTPAPMTFGDLVREWEESRADLKNFLELFDLRTVHKKVYKHPVAGRLSVLHAIEFFTEHINHHRPQINKIIRDKRVAP